MMLGNWSEVLDSFDSRKKKPVDIELVAENDGMDMFKQAGAAAE
jgi:ribonucleoside-diphosphate reductase beta chain